MALSRSAWAIILFAAVNGLVAQVLESYTAHGLTDAAGEYAATVFHMSAKYQMWHVLGLLSIGLIYDRIPQGLIKRLLMATAALFAVGTLAFSGGMYWVPFGGNVYLAVFGAIILQLGWFCFIVTAGLGLLRRSPNIS